MKRMKTLSLAAIAALGLMACVSAGPASATRLCTDAACTVVYPVGTEGEMTLESGTSDALTNTSGSTIATCAGKKINWKLVQAIGAAVSAIATVIQNLECTQTTDTIATGSFEIVHTTGDQGTVIGKGSKVTLSIFGVSCTYGTGEGTTLGTITGGEAPTLKITATIPRVEGGFLCPSTGIWHAALTITSPHAVHIGE